MPSAFSPKFGPKEVELGTVASSRTALPIWWAVPGVLGGTSMPLLHQERREHPASAFDAYLDDLQSLYCAGVRAIVCLLDLPSLAQTYSSAGFAVHLMPIADGGSPTHEQFTAFVRFVDHQRSVGHPVVVHCVAGRRRTGTVIAGYLIAQGYMLEAALAHVRFLQPLAVETPQQLHFLRNIFSIIGRNHLPIVCDS
jgi:protein-tyrosine phosphatase